MSEDPTLHPSTSGFDSEKLRVMVDQVWDPIVAIDRNDAIQFFNAAAEELFGFSAEEVLGESVHDLLAPEEYAADIERGMEIFRETGDGPILGGTRELEALTREGERVPIEITVNPYRTGGDLFAVAVVRDISERKELEEQLAEQRDWAEQYFELAGTIMVELDTDGTINRINDRGRRLLGYDQEAVIGRNWFDVATPDDTGVTSQAILKRLREGEDGVEVHENEIVTSDGEQRTIKWHNTALRDRTGDIAAILSSGTDITKRRRREEELRVQNERLDEFASVVSHDLRNPLSVAQGRATLLEEDVDSPHLDQLASALERMDGIIEDALTMARDGEAVTETASVELTNLVGQCWRMVDTAGATLEVEDQITFEGDFDRLRNLFENLFRNAVEHGGDSITVRVGVDGDVLYVEDDGPGIPPDRREAVFEAGHSTRPDGTGFGLAIVRRIAEAHGWDIRVTESEDGGARFEMSGVRRVPE